VWSLRIEIADVQKSIRSHAANPVDRFIAAIARGKDEFARSIVFREYVFRLHYGGNRNTGRRERRGRDVDQLDEISAHLSFRNARSAHQQRHVRALVVEKLLP